MGDIGSNLTTAAGLPISPSLYPFVFVFVVTVVITLIRQRAAKQQRAAARLWATSRGWTYVGNGSSLLGRWHGGPFGKGHSRSISNFVTGTFAGRPGASFDYRYTTGSGKNRTTHVHHVTVLTMPAPLPYLQLAPEDLGSAIAKVFGGEDIEFESDQFNRLWRVQSSVPRFAYDVVHPRLMERLMQPDAWLPMRFDGTDLLSWSRGKQQLEAVDRRLAFLDEVIESVPDFVWRQVGHEPR